MLLEVVELRTHLFTDDGVVKAVDGVSFSVERGRRLGIVGESGCGKSLTALSIARLIPDPPGRLLGGRILLDGRDLVPLAPHEMRRVRGCEIGFIFQDPMSSLNPVFTVGEQVAERLTEHGLADAGQAKARAIEVLREVGFPDPETRYGAYPHELSGGLRQRAMIAMALVARPKLLLADEPTTALDVTIQAQVLELLDRLTERHEMALVLITHDLGIVAERAHEVVVMYAGKIVERAKTAELFSHPSHPYTLGLLASMPKLHLGEKKRLTGIEGMVPSLSRLPVGCAFQDRCSKVKSGCREAIPPLEEKSPGHWVACFEV